MEKEGPNEYDRIISIMETIENISKIDVKRACDLSDMLNFSLGCVETHVSAVAKLYTSTAIAESTIITPAELRTITINNTITIDRESNSILKYISEKYKNNRFAHIAICSYNVYIESDRREQTLHDDCHICDKNKIHKNEIYRGEMWCARENGVIEIRNVVLCYHCSKWLVHSLDIYNEENTLKAIKVYLDDVDVYDSKRMLHNGAEFDNEEKFRYKFGEDMSLLIRNVRGMRHYFWVGRSKSTLPPYEKRRYEKRNRREDYRG